MIRQRGSVLIIVLWTAVMLTVLVTAMAGKVRLSAQVAMHNAEAATVWAEQMATVAKAEMELMLERMPDPIDYVPERTEDGEVRNEEYRFNGKLLELHYPAAEGMMVRIYDHAGKINLNRIPRRNMQLLIEKRLGGATTDPERVQDLLAAWTDWTDLNDLQSLNGAEQEYYQSLEQPYRPRNNPELDTVEEILHIRGFAELFEGVNLDAAFTIYGNERTINLNLATREAMQLIPGLDDELIEKIIALREYKDINNRAEMARFIPFENLVEVSNWVGNVTTTYYSLFVYPQVVVEDAEEFPLLDVDGFPLNPDPVTQAYMEIIEVRGYNNLPRVYKVDPYGRLPDTAPARVEKYAIDVAELLMN